MEIKAINRDHSKFQNLTWSTAGHTIDTDFTMSTADTKINLSSISITAGGDATFENIFKVSTLCMDTDLTDAPNTGDICSGFVKSNLGTVWLSLVGGGGTDTVLRAGVINDAVARFNLLTVGKMEWGPGTTGDPFDVNLYRSAANNLKTDHNFTANAITSATGFTATTGNITATDGNIVVTTGNIVATAGYVQAGTYVSAGTFLSGTKTNIRSNTTATAPGISLADEVRFGETVDETGHLGLYGSYVTSNESIIGLSVNDTSVFEYTEADDTWTMPANLVLSDTRAFTIKGTTAASTDTSILNYGQGSLITILEFVGTGTVAQGVTFKGPGGNSLLLSTTATNSAFSSTKDISFVSTGESIAFAAETAEKFISFTSPIIKSIGVTNLGDGTTNYTSISATGDVTFVGTAGLIFGHMDVPAATVITVDTSGDANPVEAKDDGTGSANDGWETGELNGTTFAASDLHYITITIAGKYEVSWNMSIATNSGQGTELHGGITVDSTTFVRDNGEGHAHVFNANDDISICGIGVIDCPNGNEEISLWIANDAAQKAIVEHGNMVIKLISGT